jgi:putative transposase
LVRDHPGSSNGLTPTIPGWFVVNWYGTWTTGAMPRRPQAGIAGHVFHVMNRCQPHELLFDSPRAYRAFLDLIEKARRATGIRILAYCLMPNHWHFILWPSEDGQLTTFVAAITQPHAKRLRRWRGNEGAGPVYPDRYLAKPLPAELNLFRAMRYVERNPVKAGLSRRVEDWPSSSASPDAPVALAVWPGGKPAEWLAFVNEEEGASELADLRAQMYDERRRGWRR